MLQLVCKERRRFVAKIKCANTLKFFTTNCLVSMRACWMYTKSMVRKLFFLGICFYRHYSSLFTFTAHYASYRIQPLMFLFYGIFSICLYIFLWYWINISLFNELANLEDSLWKRWNALTRRRYFTTNRPLPFASVIKRVQY